MTLLSVKNKCLLMAPGLHPTEIGSIIQSAYEGLTREDWSGLKTIRTVFTTPPYSTGVVSVAADGVAMGVGTTFTSAMVGCAMRVYYGDSFFTISAVGGPTSLTLQDWTGQVVPAGTSYSILKHIYSTYVNLQFIYEVTYQSRLEKKSQYYFDKIDPSRVGRGTPEFWADAGLDSMGYTQIELYPIADAVYPHRISGKLGAGTLTDSSTFALPESLVEARSLIDCFLLKSTQEPGRGWDRRARDQGEIFKGLLLDYQIEDYSRRAGPERVKDVMGGEEKGYPTGDSYWVGRDDIT